jgi:hypothetical protein
MLLICRREGKKIERPACKAQGDGSVEALLFRASTLPFPWPFAPLKLTVAEYYETNR